MNELQKMRGEIIAGFVTLAVLIKFVDAGLIPKSYIFLYNLLSIIGIFALINVIPIWSLMYTVGWVISIFFMYSMGFIDIIELIFYGVVFGIGIYVKFKG